MAQITDSLCWCCRNAYDGCAWSRDGEPVKGWRAVKHDLPPQTKGGGPVASFVVRQCPYFQLEDRFQEEFQKLHGCGNTERKVQVNA